MFWGAGAIFLLVMALTGWALVARRSQRLWLSRGATIVAGGVIVPLIVLTLLLIRGLLPSASAEGPAALRIEVVGEQWWWRVHYLNDAGDSAIRHRERDPHPGGTADRAAAALGRRHPQLLGAQSRRQARHDSRAREPAALARGPAGVLRGQCAEYCGGPHALMALHVVAQSPDAFERWRARQREAGYGAHRRNAAGIRLVPRARLRGVPRGARHTGRRHARTGPHARRQPRSLGAGTLPNDADVAGRLDRVEPARQAAEPDAVVTRCSPPSELQAIAAYLCEPAGSARVTDDDAAQSAAAPAARARGAAPRVAAAVGAAAVDRRSTTTTSACSTSAPRSCSSCSPGSWRW